MNPAHWEEKKRHADRWTGSWGGGDLAEGPSPGEVNLVTRGVGWGGRGEEQGDQVRPLSRQSDWAATSTAIERAATELPLSNH